MVMSSERLAKSSLPVAFTDSWCPEALMTSTSDMCAVLAPTVELYAACTAATGDVAVAPREAAPEVFPLDPPPHPASVTRPTAPTAATPSRFIAPQVIAPQAPSLVRPTCRRHVPIPYPAVMVRHPLRHGFTLHCPVRRYRGRSWRARRRSP